MKTVVGVYETHERAIEAVEELKRAGYPIGQVSLVGKSEVINDLIHVSYNRWIKNVPVLIGVIAGPIVGLLSGVKLISIPGIRFLYGMGAFAGAMAGFSLGMVCGGVLSLIAILVIKRRGVIKYREHTMKKGFQLIAHGNKAGVNEAKTILKKFEDQLESNS